MIEAMAQTIEPDVQATLSDFLTFTEHFPSHLTRALTLIDAETRRADEKIASIHADTTAYGALPSLSIVDREDPTLLRSRISHALEEVERAGRMRLAEATRLAEMANKENARLDVLVRKLKQIPMPSRDPTPEETPALTSPNLGRTARFGIDASPDKVNRRLQDKVTSKFRARKITVPGEVLPPLDPSAPLETMSDWSSRSSSPDFDEVMRRKALIARPRSRTPKPPRADRGDRSDREKKARSRGPRPPGTYGTNAHSAVAGISTSNALLALNPPPADAKKGSKWLPWLKLTEWEMATLRKRMKKNAIWVPSATMLRRELKELGRGHSGREEARLAAVARGEEVLDESNEPDPTRVPHPPPDAAVDELAAPLPTPDAVMAAYDDDVDEAVDAELSNRGMRLNEMKKIKRARQIQEQLEAAAQIERELGDLSAKDTTPEPSKKRKRESTPAASAPEAQETPDPLSKAGPPPRRLKLSHNAQDPQSIKKAAPTRSPGRPLKAATPPAISKKPTIVLKALKAVSEEPPNRRASLRRSSNASLPANGASRAPARRSKRPAPGVVSAPDNESVRVSASRRKAAPRKKGAAQTQAEEDDVDPDEPRYCICGDVSYGAMIACENDACDKEWFHLECVKLTELPPRRTKWYCPDCRKKLKQGQGTNGLVGRLVPSTAGR